MDGTAAALLGNRLVAVLFLVVGLPGVGKTTRAGELATARRTLLSSLSE